MSYDKKNLVVQGEALESDDEEMPDEIGQDTMVSHARHQGVVIDGEAPESDDEVNTLSSISLPVAQEATEYPYTSRSPSIHSHNINVENSILQKLLYQRNHALWQHINSFTKATVVTASSQILAADQLLMKSQVTLQAASRAIVLANDTSDNVLNKCRDVLSCDFLPEIRIPSGNKV